MQTNWKYPKNAAVQCAPREFSDDVKADIENSPEYAEFINNVAPRFVEPWLLDCLSVLTEFRGNTVSCL